MVLLSLMGSGLVVRTLMLTSGFEAWHGLLVAPPQVRAVPLRGDRRRRLRLPVPGRRADDPAAEGFRRRAARCRRAGRRGCGGRSIAVASWRCWPWPAGSTRTWITADRLQALRRSDVQEPGRGPADDARPRGEGALVRRVPVLQAGEPSGGPSRGSGDDWICALNVNGTRLGQLSADVHGSRSSRTGATRRRARLRRRAVAHPRRARQDRRQPAVRVRRLHDLAVSPRMLRVASVAALVAVAGGASGWPEPVRGTRPLGVPASPACRARPRPRASPPAPGRTRRTWSHRCRQSGPAPAGRSEVPRVLRVRGQCARERGLCVAGLVHGRRPPGDTPPRASAARLPRAPRSRLPGTERRGRSSAAGAARRAGQRAARRGLRGTDLRRGRRRRDAGRQRS